MKNLDLCLIGNKVYFTLATECASRLDLQLIQTILTQNGRNFLTAWLSKSIIWRALNLEKKRYPHIQKGWNLLQKTLHIN